MTDPQDAVRSGGVTGQDVVPHVAQLSVAVMEKYNFICLFIKEASARGIVAGVQATLLQDLAVNLCRTQQGVFEPATLTAQAAQQPVKPESCAVVGIPAAVPEPQPSPAAVMTTPPLVDVNTSAPSVTANTTAGDSAALWSLPQQPQLQIKPLDLHLGAVGASAPGGVHGSGSPHHLQDASVAVASAALCQRAASDLGFDMSIMQAAADSLVRTQAMTGPGYTEFFPGVAAAIQQEQQQHQVVASCADSLGGLHGSTAAAMAAPAAAVLGSAVPGSTRLQDPVLAAATAAPAAAAASAAAVAPTSQSQAVRSGSRKHRFTKEQQQAILESVERNYALYPSRYTELVIRQMQERFPGIEINNACVRKIKFRASEASRQTGEAVRRDSLAAADAAQGLVGLAAAAAVSCEIPAAMAAAAPARSMGAAVSGSFAVTGTTSDVDTADAKDGTFSRELSVAPGSSSKPQQQPLHAAAAAAEVASAPQQEQQQQQCEQPALQAGVKQVAKVCDDGAVDTAAVEAAEGLHMLMNGSEGGADAAAAAAMPVAPGSLKRKLDASSTAAPAEGHAGHTHHTPMQIAEALAAAAGLAAGAAGSSTTAAVHQAAAAAAGTGITAQQQQQQLTWPVAAAAAAASSAAQLAQLQQLVQLQQQQQQSLHPGSFSALQHYPSGPASSAIAAASFATPAASSAGRGSTGSASKRQRLNGVQMAELVASVRHHVQANPERYTHCVIRDMKEKYPDLELNMGQIRKIKFRTLGNINPRQGVKPQQQQQQQQPALAHPTAACCLPIPQDDAAAAAAAGTVADNVTAAAAGALPVSGFGPGAMNAPAVNAAKLLAAAATRQQGATGTCAAAAAAGVEAAGAPAGAGADN